MDDPHASQPIERGGTALEAATAGIVLVHGRGATAPSILQLGQEVHEPGVAMVAPQAARNEWYPNSFLAPVERNEPGRTSGLAHVGRSLELLGEHGVDRQNVLVLGFSQGGCLASEYVARNPRRYGGLAVLSGGLIGESVARADYPEAGDLEDTPAFLGCSDVDPHIPVERVHETASILEALGGAVETRIYEGMGHGVNEDEIQAAADLVNAIVG